MKRISVRMRVLVIASAACVILLGLAAARYFSAPRFSADDPAYNKAFWAYEIRAEGPERAYETFKSLVAGIPEDARHLSAHAFGSSLFQTRGDAGLSSCDSSFGYGCYHGFFLTALESEGESKLAALDDVCLKAGGAGTLACQHGIGHGILAFLGRDKLVDALEACARLPRPDPVGGCTSGVFMEYNLPLQPVSVAQTVMNPRPFNEEESYAPCPSVPEAFRLSCYHELPQWWAQSFGHDFGKVGRLCGGAPEGTEREECFEGAGAVAVAAVGFSPADIASVCDTMPNVRGADFCREGAAWLVKDESKESAALLCAPLSDDVRVFCPPL